MSYFQASETLSLFYTLAGDASKPPILLLHGWCCDSHDWSWQIPVLSKDHHVIATDLRGHGRSSAPKDITYSPFDYVADGVALLSHLKITKKVVVIGHSMGAITTSAFAVLHPEIVKGIVIIDAPYFYPAAVCDVILPTWKSAQSIHATALSSYAGLTVDDTPAWMKTWYARRVEGTPEHVVYGAIMALYDTDGLGRAETSAEFVKGRRNVPRLAVSNKDETADAERAFGVGEKDVVVAMKDVGHWMHQVESEKFNALLLDWLAVVEKE